MSIRVEKIKRWCKRGVRVMYYYSTVNDIVMTHSAILEKDGFEFDYFNRL